VFSATQEDLSSRVHGRHKQVLLHQVGIRCRHCAHIVAEERVKGAVYFPSSTMGFYEAAQNMCSLHVQCGLCPEMPESTKKEFALLIGTKTVKSSSVGGRAYWGRYAQQMGLMDTEKGEAYHFRTFIWVLAHLC
jgi:phage FluMu protein Com